ncbi:MAG: hypothetical protein J4F98_10315 [Acidobacteria bacterium]|nr:hypothetical protein [Acidobacteriota bacterium]
MSTREEQRRQLWGVIVSALVVVELFFDGFPEGPDAGSWGEARGPLLIVAVGVLALLAGAAVQAKWGRREGWDSSSARPRELGGYPAWFGFAAFAMGIVGLGLFAYAVCRSLREGGSLHVLERRVAVILLVGSGALTSLISWLSRRGTPRGQGDS